MTPWRGGWVYAALPRYASILLKPVFSFFVPPGRGLFVFVFFFGEIFRYNNLDSK